MEDGLLGLTRKDVENAFESITTFSVTTKDAEQKIFAELIVDGLKAFYTNISVANINDTYFLANHGRPFTQAIQRVKTSNDLDKDSLFWLGFYLYALFQERAFLEGTHSDYIVRLRNYFEKNYLAFDDSTKCRIDYLKFNISSHILERKSIELLNQQSIFFNEEKTKIAEFTKQISDWKTNIGASEKRANDLELNLKNSVEKLNFVGLSKAFSNLITEKNAEKTSQIFWMVVLGSILLLLPFSPIIYGFFTEKSRILTLETLPNAIPFAVFELVALYFFRIFLHNFYSVKAQLLQLKLRHGICAFIQGYAEFADKSRKSNDDKLFEKFEALIFSGISPDPQNVPSQFDGIEQISKIFKELKGKA